MSDATVFYMCGSILAASALLVSFAGLRFERFPGRMTPLVAIWFVVLVGGTTTYAVLTSKHEEEERAAELEKAGEEIAEEEESPVGGGETEASGKPPEERSAAGGPGGTLTLAADPTQIAFDKTTLTSRSGEVTINFTNPATVEHDVAIEKAGKEIAVSETITAGETSVSADLAPGSYTFLCTVPGHAEAGMEGTLTIK